MSVALLHLLILVSVANSVPIILARLMGDTFAQPVDFGKCFVDGRPMLGQSKTWRGVIGAVACCALLALPLGYPVIVGASAGALAMLGDMLSSFAKRRMALASSARAPALDQLPESAIPAIALKSVFGLDWLDVGLVVMAFVVLDVVFSVISYRLGIRKRPY